MAYNREWDHGKDSWHDVSWNGADNRAHVRPREEDHHGEMKRRKFNNGGFQVYDTAQGYGDSGHERSNPQGAERFQDYGQDDRHQRPGVNKKRLTPSEPSPHVIFLGLDPDFTEADVCVLFSSSSKGFGFAQFTTTEHARAFVDPLFPFIQVPPPASHGATATATYYKSLETGTPTNGRRVKIDYSQSASPHDRNRFNRGNMNDGTRDIGNTQAPVLLFRGLDPLSGPQAIYQAMLYSSGPNMQGAKGMKRIILIKDKVTMASFGFAFVEFIDVASASVVLAATMSPAIHPAGFRISDRPVAASFAHPYSFQPVTDFLSRDEACLMSSMSLGGIEGSWVRYWDENSTVAVLEFRVEEQTQTTQPKEKKEKKKKSKSPPRLAPAAPSALPVSDKPVMLSFSKGPTKPTIAKPLVLGFSMDDIAGESGDHPDDSNLEATNAIAAKKAAPLIANKKKNFKDANLRDIARQKVATRRTDTTEQPKYRDRASERRVLFNQPELPVPEKDISMSTKQKLDAPLRPQSPPPPPVNPGEDANNVGNKLLKMMGWKEGSGLGTSGEGRVEPIQTAIYEQGAGLGASKGKEIAKYTQGYAGYVHMAQDS
ncbi:hypothetical protein H0H81_002688, partial [Sphagnurus paluster]